MRSQLRVIDKRVSVMLNTIYSLIAVRLQGTYRVIAVPFQELTDGPRRQVLIVAVGEHGTALALGPSAHAVHVANHHIEIGTCKVTLILIGNLKHGTRITAVGATSQFAGSSC